MKTCIEFHSQFDTYPSVYRLGNETDFSEFKSA
jgi:hypothetical protein